MEGGQNGLHVKITAITHQRSLQDFVTKCQGKKLSGSGEVFDSQVLNQSKTHNSQNHTIAPNSA